MLRDENMKETPKYLLIAKKLRHEIETDEYQANDQLPKELDLAKSYNVSRITVRNALKELENDGLIYRIQGAGTYVKEHQFTKSSTNTELLEMVNLKKYKLHLLDFEVGPVASKIYEALKINSYDVVYTIKRAAVTINKQLVAFQKIYIPAKVIQGLNMEMLESSIYPLVKEKVGVQPKNAMRSISLINASSELIDAYKLNEKIVSQEPLLKCLQISYLEDGRPFEWNQTYYRITRFPIKESIII